MPGRRGGEAGWPASSQSPEKSLNGAGERGRDRAGQERGTGENRGYWAPTLEHRADQSRAITGQSGL